MNGRRAIVGLSLLCALVFSALGAASASAVGTGTTQFECGSGLGAKDFKDAHCKEGVTPGTGSFGHKEIATGTKTAITAENLNTDGSRDPARLHGTLVGNTITIQCNKVVSTGTATNETKEEKMEVVGSAINIKYTECTVTEGPPGCQIVGGEVEVPSAKSTTIVGVGAKKTGVRFEPTVGNTFASFTFKECSVPSLNITFAVTGSAVGTPSGTTLNFTEASTKGEAGNGGLFVGGQPAFLLGSVTVRMKEGNPIALTTTTP